MEARRKTLWGGIGAGISGAAMVPVVLFRDAVTSWTNTQIASYFGWTAPSVAQVINLAIILVPSAATGAFCIWIAYWLGTTRPKSKRPNEQHRSLIPWVRSRNPIWRFESSILNCDTSNELVGTLAIKFNTGSAAFTRIKRCVAISNITGESIEVRFGTSRGWELASSLGPLPGGREFDTDVMFYDPDKVYDENKQVIRANTGMRQREFIRNWGSFTFVMSYTLSKDGHTDGRTRTIRHNFSRENVWHLLIVGFLGEGPE